MFRRSSMASLCPKCGTGRHLLVPAPDSGGDSFASMFAFLRRLLRRPSSARRRKQAPGVILYALPRPQSTSPGRRRMSTTVEEFDAYLKEKSHDRER